MFERRGTGIRRGRRAVLAALLAAAVSCAAHAQPPATAPTTRPMGLTDEQLLELVQRQTFRYFWDHGHPKCGLALERTTGTPDQITIGGSGFGILAMLVGVERGWITRDQCVERLETMLTFLERVDRYHGAYTHWLNGSTGEEIPYSDRVRGGDIVETSFLFQGLLAARQYFDAPTPRETQLRERITRLWHDVDWNWYTNGGQPTLTWHWSPVNAFGVNHRIRGWNECLITYVLAASSPTHPIDPAAYHKGYMNDGAIANGQSFYGIRLPLGHGTGGPLFFAHYSFLGLDPRKLSDRYANYWEQNVAQTRINRAYCIANPNKFSGYGEQAWGLTASVSVHGYAAHAPTPDADLGVIAPTAALSSFPYTPAESMQVLRYLYDQRGDELWSEYGFVDAFSDEHRWHADEHLAIDQGPIIVMIENHRTGLLWNTFMRDPDVQQGLKRLGFTWR